MSEKGNVREQESLSTQIFCSIKHLVLLSNRPGIVVPGYIAFVIVWPSTVRFNHLLRYSQILPRKQYYYNSAGSYLS